MWFPCEQDMESEHSVRKQAYDSVMLDSEAKVSQLQKEVASYKCAIMDAQRSYHLVTCQLHTLDTDLHRFMGTDPRAIREKYEKIKVLLPGRICQDLFRLGFCCSKI